MPALSTIAVVADHPRLAPSFSTRACFTHWWWRRWVERESPPPEVVDWMASSSLVSGNNTVDVTELCDALSNWRPSLRMWNDALTVPSATEPAASEADAMSLLAELALPAPSRRGMESVIDELLVTASAIGRKVSFVVNGSIPLLLDPAVLVSALPSQGFHHRERRTTSRRGLQLFGAAPPSPHTLPPALFSLIAVTHVCRPPNTIDVFPSPHIIADAFRQLDAQAAAVEGTGRDGGALGETAAGGSDEAGGSDDEAAADDEALEELIGRFVEPEMAKRRLCGARLRLSLGVSPAELLRLVRAERTLLFGHGTTVEAAALARRWGLHDPRLRAWMRMGIPPGCMAIYYVPILDETSVFRCASFALAKHTVKDNNGRLASPDKVEVMLFRAPRGVYDRATTMAGRHVFGAGFLTADMNPALGVLNLLQMKAGRFCNWVIMCGTHAMRVLCVHPVAEATGLAGAMLGGAVDGARSVSNVFGPDARNRMEEVGSLTFDVTPDA